jgi:tripartite-type tricarboxylate transporter receptor subunit TctC
MTILLKDLHKAPVLSSGRLTPLKLMLGILSLISLFAMGSASAQTKYPVRSIQMVVPFSAGGGADETARELARRLTVILGQSVVVDNRPGAGNSVGESLVARAPADGYTLLYDTSPFAVNASLRKLSFNLRESLQPVSLVVTAQMILVCAPSLPVKNVKELINYVKSNSGQVSFASAGVGSAAHFAGETLNAMAGIDMLHIPYKGGTGAITDVLGGRVAVYFSSPVASQAYVKSQRLTALAVSSPFRLPEFPEVPALAEAGLPGFDIQTWHGVFVPSGTPVSIVSQLNQAIHEALADPALKEKFDKQGYQIKANSPTEFASFIDAEIARWASMARDRNIVLDP